MVFLRNYRFDFLQEGHNQKPYTKKKGFAWQFSQLVFFASKSGHSQKSNFFNDLCRYSISNFSRTIGLFFFRQGINQRAQSIRGEFDGKTIDINPCLKILIVQKFQRIVIEIFNSRLSKRCFSVTAGLISFMRVSITNLTPTK